MVELTYSSNDMKALDTWRDTIRLKYGVYPVTTAKIVKGEMILKSKITIPADEL